MEYRARLSREDDKVLISFPDLPGHSFGDNEGDALAHGKDALITGPRSLHQGPSPDSRTQ